MTFPLPAGEAAASVLMGGPRSQGCPLVLPAPASSGKGFEGGTLPALPDMINWGVKQQSSASLSLPEPPPATVPKKHNCNRPRAGTARLGLPRRQVHEASARAAHPPSRREQQNGPCIAEILLSPQSVTLAPPASAACSVEIPGPQIWRTVLNGIYLRFCVIQRVPRVSFGAWSKAESPWAILCSCPRP